MPTNHIPESEWLTQAGYRLGKVTGNFRPSLWVILLLGALSLGLLGAIYFISV